MKDRTSQETLCPNFTDILQYAESYSLIGTRPEKQNENEAKQKRIAEA